MLPTSSATSANPAPFGTDVNGNPVNDPIPDTLVDPATGSVVSSPADGPSVLLDRFIVTKPDLEERLVAQLSAPESLQPGAQLTYLLTATNRSSYNLNGTQAVFNLPDGVSLLASPDGSTTQIGNSVVVTIGRLAVGSSASIHLTVSVGTTDHDRNLTATGSVRSGTALPVQTNEVRTHLKVHGSGHDND